MRTLGAGSLLVALLASGPAQADEAGDCVDANEQAITLRKAHKLLEARVVNARCAAVSCVEELRHICDQRAEKLNAAIPSVVFDVKDGQGRDQPDVEVTMDGQARPDARDGIAIEVDPGEHVFRFTSPGQAPLERTLVLVEGEVGRRERVVVGPIAPVAVAAPPAPVEAAAARPASTGLGRPRTLALVAGAIGAGGLALGAVTGLVALSSWNSAKAACGPSFPSSCRDPGAANGDRNTTLATSTVSTVSFVVGGAAVAAGAALWLTAPSGSSRVGLVPALGPDGAALLARGTFR